MNELTNLKDELDKIDSGMMNAVVEGFYNSRLKILIGMWEKGRVIGTFTGVEVPNWREYERQTGRPHSHLKLWHDLYKNNIEKKKYIEKVAKPKALAWAQKALQPKGHTPELDIDPIDSSINILEKWIEKFSKESRLSEFIPIIENLIQQIKEK
jgi:hypothetical protein